MSLATASMTSRAGSSGRPRKQCAWVLAALLLPTPVLAAAMEGFTEPSCVLELSALPQPGRVEAVHVREGQAVQRGQLLAELDARLLNASLALAQRRAEMAGRMRAAEADLALQTDRYSKLKLLHTRGHSTPGELARAAADVEVAQAKLIMVREERELALLECRRIELQIEQHEIRSPVDGIVAELHRAPGEMTQIGDARIVSLVQLNVLKIKFPVSMAVAARLQPGDDVTVVLPEISRTAPATVSLVAPVLDATSGTVLVTCAIDNRDGRLRSGMRGVLKTDAQAAP